MYTKIILLIFHPKMVFHCPLNHPNSGRITWPSNLFKKLTPPHPHTHTDILQPLRSIRIYTHIEMTYHQWIWRRSSHWLTLLGNLFPGDWCSSRLCYRTLYKCNSIGHHIRPSSHHIGHCRKLETRLISDDSTSGIFNVFNTWIIIGLAAEHGLLQGCLFNGWWLRGDHETPWPQTYEKESKLTNEG